MSIAALSAGDVVDVRVTITAPDISPPLVIHLNKDVDGVWRGSLSAIPAGPNRTLTTEALDMSGEVVYRATSMVDIVPNQTAQVHTLLQAVQPVTPYQNSAPYFTSLVASTNRITLSSQVGLSAAATDPDGDPLTFHWTGDGGTFGAMNPSADGAAVTWTSPSVAGTYHVNVEVSDAQGAKTSLGLAILVTSEGGITGAGTIDVQLNARPLISSIVAQPAQLEAGGTITLTPTASDPDDDALTFAWQTDCAGSFSDSAVMAPSFTLEAESTATNCSFTVSISDGRGGNTAGVLSVHVGAPVVPTLELLAVAPRRGLITSEQNSGTATFTVWLKGPPSAEAVIALASDDTSEGTVSPSTLSFTEENWSIPQLVTVTGVDDGIGDGDQDFTVTVGPITSADALFAAQASVTVTVTNQDPSAVHLTATTLVSVSTAGVQGNRDSGSPVASEGGRFIAFMSGADNLVAGDTNQVPDIFVRDLLNGITERVNLSGDGVEANALSTLVDISADGNLVLFTSLASNLVADDTNNDVDVFIRDRQAQQTTRVNVKTDFLQGGPGLPPAVPFSATGTSSLSSDGRYVAMFSSPGCDDTVPLDGYYHPCIHDLSTGESRGVEVPIFQFEARWSKNGRFFTFVAVSLESGSSFVARTDIATWTTAQVDTSDSGAPGNVAPTGESRPSADGHLVAFSSVASNLIAGDTNGETDTFVKNMDTGEVRRVSVNSAGQQAIGNTFPAQLAISPDGRYVEFCSTAYNLVANDDNRAPDEFLHDLVTGETRRIREGGCFAPSFSDDNRFVVFFDALYEVGSQTLKTFPNGTRIGLTGNGRIGVIDSFPDIPGAGDHNMLSDVFAVPLSALFP